MTTSKTTRVRREPVIEGVAGNDLFSIVVSVSSTRSPFLKSSSSKDRLVPERLSATTEDKLIREAVSSTTWKNLERIGFMSREIADVVDTSVKTVQRKKQSSAKLSLSQADRTVRLAKVYVDALRAIGENEKVMRWLRSPLRHLGGRTPIEMIATEAGTALVRESIGAIAYGGVG